MSLQEEQIVDLKSSNVAATCRQLRDYVQFELSAQPRVGLNFFSGDYFQVLDRVFGDTSSNDGNKPSTSGSASSYTANPSSTTTRPGSVTRSSSAARPKDPRSWLRATVNSPSAGGPPAVPGTLRGMQLSRPAAELVRLLALSNDDGSSLIAVARSWRYSQARLPISLLPIRSQQKLLNSPDYNYVRSTNCDELYDSLLYVKRYEQRFAGPHSMLDVTVFEYYCMQFARYPTMADSPYAQRSGHAPVGSVTSAVLAMGLPGNDIRGESGSVGATPPKNAIEVLHTMGPNGWLKANPYMVLLSDYLRYFFPADGSLREDSTLFLRILIEMWLEQCSILRYDAMMNSGTFDGPPHSATRRSTGYSPKKVSVSSGYAHSHHAQSRQLYPYGAGNALTQRPTIDAVQFLGSSTPPWTAYALQCVYLLCDHLLRSEGYLHTMYYAAADTLHGQEVHDQYQMVMNKRAGKSGAAALIGTSHVEAVAERQLGSPRLRRDSTTGIYFGGMEGIPAVSILQQPVFDMLRHVFFRREQTSWVVFALATEIWLQWLIPEHAHSSPSGGQSRSGAASPFLQRVVHRHQSNTTAVLWRRHVIENYLFYAMLPIMFFKSVAELDFSSNNESSCYLALWEAVVDVFTPQVVALLERCHRCMESLRPESTTRARANSSSAMCSRDIGTVPDLTHEEITALITHNQRVLRSDSDSIPKDLRLQSWRQHGLACYRQLHVHAQKGKKAVWSTSDRNERMQKLAEKVRELFEIPPEAVRSIQLSELATDAAPPETNQFIESLKYLGILAEDAGIVVAAPDRRPEQDESGSLTVQGRVQLQSGTRQFRPSNIGTFYNRDVMLYPIYSTEIPWLARLLVKASKVLNFCFQLPLDDRTTTYSWDRQFQLYLHDVSTIGSTFRFNLRFLADWRVLAAFTVLCVILFTQRLKM